MPASIRHFKTKGLKDKEAQERNIANHQSITLSKDIDAKRREKIIEWNTFFRNNIHYFIEMYLGIKLHAYQRYMVDLMSKSSTFLGIASRASAKSWLIAVYAIARCILYPGTKVVLASETKYQAGLIISEKIVNLSMDYPNVKREILSLISTANRWECQFSNGSTIKVVNASDRGRGNRSTCLVLEERRLIPDEVINGILRPFQEARQAPYMKLDDYLHLPPEEPMEIVITSAYYKSFEWYAEAKKALVRIVNGDNDTKAVFFDYLISIKHKIKTPKQMKAEQEKFDPITFLQEYGNVPYSTSSMAFFKSGMFNRNMKKAWRPRKDDNFDKNNPYDIKRQPDERRVISADIAIRKGAGNDNTVVTCARLLPTNRGWSTEIVYMESMNGRNAELQALRIKQLMHEFDGDVLVLDVLGVGGPIYDILTSITKDDERGIEYQPYTVMAHDAIEDNLFEDLRERTRGANARECVFPINATLPLNSAISIAFRDRLKKRLLSFLVDDSTAETFLIETHNKDILDQEDLSMRAFLLQPHIQTTLLINESISLEMKKIGGLVKLEEPPNCRKDRYTSCSYLNYYVSLLDKELLREGNPSDDLSSLMGVTMIY